MSAPRHVRWWICTLGGVGEQASAEANARACARVTSTSDLNMSSSFWGLIWALRSRTNVAHKCEAAFLRGHERACPCERVCEKDRGAFQTQLTCFRIGRCCGTRSTGPAQSQRARVWPPASPSAPPKSDRPGARARSRHLRRHHESETWVTGYGSSTAASRSSVDGVISDPAAIACWGPTISACSISTPTSSDEPRGAMTPTSSDQPRGFGSLARGTSSCANDVQSASSALFVPHFEICTQNVC